MPQFTQTTGNLIPNTMTPSVHNPVSLNNPVEHTYVLPTYSVNFSDKIIPKFYGYMHENADKFIREFESFLVLSNINYDTEPHRAIAAFHLHLKGPALTWFSTLTDKSSWDTVRIAFSSEFSNANDPMYIAESALFDKLCLSSRQPIEEFHALVHEKGMQLNKPERDITNKFIQGLPDKLAFFVRASRPSSYRDALNSAKIGEAHGYRTVPMDLATTCIVSGTDLAVNPSVASVSHTQSRNGVRPRHRVVCHKCSGSGHIQRICNWNGNESGLDTSTVCQLCDQNGHGAKFCLKNLKCDY